MGLFGKSKRSQQVQALTDEVTRSLALSQQLQQQATAGAGMDMNTMLQAASAAMAPGVMQEMAAYRDRVTRLHAHGIETPATLRSIARGEPSPMLGGRSARMSLTVEPAGAASYEVDTEQVLHDTMAAALTPGARVTVKVDPNDANCLMVWSTGTPTAPTTATEDPTSRLAKLQKLRDMGALTDEEFEAKKAQILLAE
ncbi:MAG: hypothetical protein QOJ46_2310 [bacterium]